MRRLIRFAQLTVALSVLYGALALWLLPEPSSIDTRGYTTIGAPPVGASVGVAPATVYAPAPTTTAPPPGAAWLGQAERQWSSILAHYAEFINGEADILAGNAQLGIGRCTASWPGYKSAHDTFWPIPKDISLNAIERADIETLLMRADRDGRGCMEGKVRATSVQWIREQDEHLLTIAQALDRIGADR